MSGPGHNSGRPAFFDVDPDQLAHDLENRGIEWALADGEARRRERMLKIFLAELVNQLRSSTKSATERESLALGDPRYKAAAEAAEEARTSANVAWAKYEAMKVRLELLRTKAATERAAMTMR